MRKVVPRFVSRAFTSTRGRARAYGRRAVLCLLAWSWLFSQGCCFLNKKQVAFQMRIGDVGDAVSQAVKNGKRFSTRKLIRILGPPDVILRTRGQLRAYLKKSPWGKPGPDPHLLWKHFAEYANGRLPPRYAANLSEGSSGATFWKWRARHPNVIKNAVHPAFWMYDEEKRFKHPLGPCFCCVTTTELEIFAVVDGRAVNASDYVWRENLGN